LIVEEKSVRVARYHAETVKAAVELMGAAGLDATDQLRPWHIVRRVSPLETLHYGEIGDYLKPGDLLQDEPPPSFARSWRAASASTFAHVE
jgi:hypothetical protein